MEQQGLRTYDGAVAIVTGAASGLGRALAMELAWSGAEVVLADLQLDAAREATREITGAGGKATAAEIDRAVAHSSLKALQGQERLAGFRERLPGQGRFFRSGRVEGWRDVLSTAQIRAIEDQCAATMIRWGYALAG